MLDQGMPGGSRIVTMSAALVPRLELLPDLVGGAVGGELVEDDLGFGRDGAASRAGPRVRGDDRADLGGIALAGQGPGVDVAHGAQVPGDAGGDDLPGRAGVFAGGGDGPGRHREGARVRCGGLAQLAEPGRPGGEAVAGHQRGDPAVAEFGGHPGGVRAQRGDPDGQLGSGRLAQAQRARAPGRWRSWAGRPPRSARTPVTTSRSFPAGCSNGVSWNPSASALVLAPRPSTYRPPQTWWRVAAVIASVAGVRPQTDRTPEATWILAVRSAISVSTGVESSPQPSGTAKVSYPSSSASTAARTMTSRRVSIGVSPTPRRRAVMTLRPRPGRRDRARHGQPHRPGHGEHLAAGPEQRRPGGELAAVTRRPARRSPGTGRRPRAAPPGWPSSGRARWRCPGPGRRASAAAIPLGQSSAAQTISGRTLPSAPATEGSGVHGAAHNARPGTGPGKIRSPSPGRRLIPQTKQSGKTGSWKYRARPAAARASASETGPGISSAGRPARRRASAISVRP